MAGLRRVFPNPGRVRVGGVLVGAVVAGVLAAGCGGGGAGGDGDGGLVVDVVVDPTVSRQSEDARVEQVRQVDVIAKMVAERDGRISVYALGPGMQATVPVAVGVDLTPSGGTDLERTAGALRVRRELLDRVIKTLQVPVQGSDVIGALAYVAQQPHPADGEWRVYVLGDITQVTPGADWHRTIPTPKVAVSQAKRIAPGLSLAGAQVTMTLGSGRQATPDGIRLANAWRAVITATGAKRVELTTTLLTSP